MFDEATIKSLQKHLTKMEKESGCPDAKQEKGKERETKIKDAIDSHHNALIIMH